MKRIISLLMAAIALSCIFTACKKEPDPIEIDIISSVDYIYVSEKEDFQGKTYVRSGVVDNGTYYLESFECYDKILVKGIVKGKPGYIYNNVQVTWNCEGFIGNAYQWLGGFGSAKEKYKTIDLEKTVTLSEDGYGEVVFELNKFGNGAPELDYISNYEFDQYISKVTGSVTPVED